MSLTFVAIAVAIVLVIVFITVFSKSEEPAITSDDNTIATSNLGVDEITQQTFRVPVVEEPKPVVVEEPKVVKKKKVD